MMGQRSKCRWDTLIYANFFGATGNTTLGLRGMM
ncbi:hypothetical protein I315_06218 [Cryptococcus gattii Ru294]|nr:hypothetical protein I315_06218 [Cryptococcus gattii Ru294]KIR78273.1 hypothetical protein I306_04715 [Cryptococcus gattii EJB2]KIY33035.1 hypothetical protein I305_04362 [Cryptococcus gattii E566]